MLSASDLCVRHLCYVIRLKNDHLKNNLLVVSVNWGWGVKEIRAFQKPRQMDNVGSFQKEHRYHK